MMMVNKVVFKYDSDTCRDTMKILFQNTQIILCGRMKLFIMIRICFQVMKTLLLIAACQEY